MSDNNEKYNRIIFSPVAGAVEALIMQPIDTIKVKSQSNQFPGTFKPIKTKGVRSLYKGLTPYISQMSIKYILRFSTFEISYSLNSVLKPVEFAASETRKKLRTKTDK